MTEFLWIVDPAAEEKLTSVSHAPRLASLTGVRLGLIDNTKHMALPLLREVEALLKERFGVASFAYYRKENPSVPTPPAVLAEMAATCEAVIHGVAD